MTDSPTTPSATPTLEFQPAALFQPVVKGHHKFGPSKLTYLDACAAFTSHDGTTAAAEEGTFLHERMEEMLTKVKCGVHKTTWEQLISQAVAHNLEEDSQSYLRFCCKKIDSLLARNPEQIHIELSVSAKNEAGKEMNHGSLDVLFIFAGGVGILCDFKFGYQPVKSASQNLQGKNYALGCFQRFLDLNKIGVVFIQPKLNSISEAVFQRADIAALIHQISDVVERAEFVQAHPEAAQKFMAPGTYCRYCAKAPTCAVLANHRGVVHAKYTGLPLPPTFKGLELHRPEDIALARYWVDVVETAFSEVKSAAFMAARNNGGSISCTLPDGSQITYEMKTRNSPRSLGAAAEVADALKEFVTPEEVLAAAELKITALEPLVKNAMVERAKMAGEKLTKKDAWEQAQSTLEALGLLTQADKQVEYLKLTSHTNQLNEGK